MNASRAQIDEQAWRWVVRMDADDWTPADEAAFQAWLGADPKHPGALLQAEAMWMAIGNAAPAITDGDMADPSAPAPATPWYSRRAVLAGGATALAASIVGGALLIGHRTVYATDVGEIRRVPLADGSTSAINTASRIDIRLAEKTRSVRLDEGEAWFQVAKDRNRPFVVEAGRIRAQALGTAFAVRLRDHGADILVTEGVVEAWVEGAEGNRIRLTAGQRAFVADNAAITSAPGGLASVDRSLAWRSGRVDFVDNPIVDAVAEFNRYNRRKLVIVDPVVGRERFDGVFRIDDPEGFATAVRDSLAVPVDLSHPNEIRIGDRGE